RVDVEVRLGHRLPHREVLDLLVDVLVTRGGGHTAGQRDDGRAGHVRVAHAGGEVRRSDGLGETHARTARRTRLAVGAVGRGLLAVRDHATDPHVLHLGHGRKHDRGDEEDVREAIGVRGFGEVPVARHPWHGGDLLVAPYPTRGEGAYG